MMRVCTCTGPRAETWYVYKYRYMLLTYRHGRHGSAARLHRNDGVRNEADRKGLGRHGCAARPSSIVSRPHLADGMHAWN